MAAGFTATQIAEQMKAMRDNLATSQWADKLKSHMSEYSLPSALRYDAMSRAEVAAAMQPNPNRRFSDGNLKSMIESRMGWNVAPCPFRRVYPVKLESAETVAVFVALEHTAIVINDEAALYPSDALVTQLRLLEGK
jgi:hypothetical protein